MTHLAPIVIASLIGFTLTCFIQQERATFHNQPGHYRAFGILGSLGLVLSFLSILWVLTGFEIGD